ncbi:MAG: DNA replication/repair protein RecF [Alphaproteobacteria bacterium]|nr:DNA replication/repair protein RecF [Alphaproteobacteria bacterium]
MTGAIRRLDLTDFRNYRSLRLEIDAAPVVLTGANGAGKTNLLEALSFLAPGRGLRRAALGDVTRAQNDVVAPGWAVAARVDTVGGQVALGTGIEGLVGGAQRSRRVVRIDGAPARGQASLAEHLSIVWLTPEMDRLFQEGSSGRRRFIDRMVFGFDPEHANRLAAYEQAVRGRQRLLRDNTGDGAWLSVLEETIASSGIALAAARREAVAKLDAALKSGDATADLPFPRAGIELVGEVDRWLAEGPALAAEDQLRAVLAATRGRDGSAGRTEHGPHRSDLKVSHIDKNMPAARCSTGEQKALLIAMVLAHAHLLALDRGAAPVLLLDEVAAHLDEGRRAALAARILDLGAQAWLTGTDDSLFESFRGAAQFFQVADASVSSAISQAVDGPENDIIPMGN